MTDVIRPYLYIGHDGEAYSFICPGCGEEHALSVTRGVGYKGPVWGWNNSTTAPTFTPSLLVTGVEDLTEDEYAHVMAGEKVTSRPMVCHSYITDGMISFLGDCTHQHKNKVLPLPPITESPT